MRRSLVAVAAVLTLGAGSIAARQQTTLPADPGAYAETDAGVIPPT